MDELRPGALRKHDMANSLRVEVAGSCAATSKRSEAYRLTSSSEVFAFARSYCGFARHFSSESEVVVSNPVYGPEG
eukprot:6176633-Pleurochrysis_carterae.AAC.1